MFSESNRWGAITGVNMATALQNLVGTSLNSYLTNNFDQRYLGDFSSLTAPATQAVTKGTAYNCDEMKKVWTAAKCQDFANAATSDNKSNTNANTDFFYMSSYVGNDYRKYPANYVCQAATTWAATYATSVDSDNHYPKETYNAYDKFFKPTACADPGIIKTGVKVIKVGGQAANNAGYDEIICVTPGCASNATGSACE